MRPSYFLVCALLSPAVTGCSDSLPSPPVSTPPQPTAIHIKSEKPPLLVAYRDGFDTTANAVPWTVDKSTDLTNVTFMAKTAYSIAVVCQVDANTVLTWESLRVVRDDKTDDVPEPTIETPCKGPPPARRTATGMMVQQGFAHLDDADQQSTSASWTVNLLVNEGTFDLVASSDLADPSMNKTLIRRDVVVNASGANLATIDVTSGAAQVPVDIALDSPPSDDPMESTETVSATVDVTTKNNAGPARVSHANYDLTKQSIKLFGLPSAALTDDDSQSVTFTGFDQPKEGVTTIRSFTRPFTVGDDVATGMAATGLPSKISGQNWKFECPATMPQCSDAMKNRLSVALPALPALDTISIETSGTSLTDATKAAVYQIDITARYFGATALARPVFDTDITGFQDLWKINFQKQYSRQITTQHDKLDDDDNFVDHETSQFLEDVKP